MRSNGNQRASHSVSPTERATDPHLASRPPASVHPAAESARARSYVYGLLAAALRDPDNELFARLAIVPPERLSPISKSVRDRLRVLARAASRTTVPKARDEYLALFGHAVRGASPPYELEYGNGEIIQRASQLADIAGFYEAFGLSFAGTNRDRPDHFSTESEFLAVLAAKEANAHERGHDDHVRQCRDTQRVFLRDHWAVWTRAFAHRLVTASGEGFYGCVGSCIDAFVATECDDLGLRAGPIALALRPTDPEADTTIRCDMGAGGSTEEEPCTSACDGSTTCGTAATAARKPFVV